MEKDSPTACGSSLAVEREFECPCGCGAKAKGFFRPKGWVGITVYCDDPPRVKDGWVFPSFACLKRFFASWEPPKEKGEA